MRRFKCVATLAALLLTMNVFAEEASQPVSKSQDSQLTAEQILDKAFSGASFGAGQGTATMSMTISSKDGASKERMLSIKTRKGEDGLTSSILRFEKPTDVKGTSFMMKEKKNDLPEQFIYLPATKAVKRVAAGNATSSFFGSDFIYGDFLPYPKGSNTVKLARLPDDTLGGQAVYKVEILPQQKESPYSKLVAYVDKKNNVALQMDFFDRDGKLLKVLKMRKLQKVSGNLVPVDLEMKNVQTESSTQLKISNINPKAPLKASDFTEAAMQRG